MVFINTDMNVVTVASVTKSNANVVMISISEILKIHTEKGKHFQDVAQE